MEYVSFVMIYTFKCLHNSYLFVNMTVSNVYGVCLTLNQHFVCVFLLLLITKSTSHQPQVLLHENEPCLVSEWTVLNALSSFQRVHNSWFGLLLVLAVRTGGNLLAHVNENFSRDSSAFRCSQEHSRRFSSPGVAITFTRSLRQLVLGLWTWRTTFTPDQSVWDLCWTEWHWDGFFSGYFGFPRQYHSASVVFILYLLSTVYNLGNWHLR
jgi:hypothetical protein